MAESFVGIEIAVIVVTASVLFAGILWGVGRAFGWKRIELFGIEELIQSMINSAIIGSFAAVIELVGAVSSTVVGESCKDGNVVTQLSCTLGTLNAMLFSMFQNLAETLNLIGYYQTLSLDFGAFGISPFSNLSAVSSLLSLQLLSLDAIIILMELNRQIASFIGQNALGLLFPVGLVLRTFFATRRVGGFLIALAVGLFIFYPTFILVFPNPQNDINTSTELMGNFTNNSFYASVPVLDLNSNNAIAAKLDLMSGRCDPTGYSITNLTNASNTTTLCDDFLADNYLENVSNISNVTIYNYTLANRTFDFTGELTLITQSNSNTLSKSLLYSVIAPIFSLVITIVFVRELANILGSEIGLKTIASV
ncbi:MAG: hypothetical protein AB1324_03650 [Candidatus Micrarchaeota archaeon]